MGHIFTRAIVLCACLVALTIHLCGTSYAKRSSAPIVSDSLFPLQYDCERASLPNTPSFHDCPAGVAILVQDNNTVLVPESLLRNDDVGHFILLHTDYERKNTLSVSSIYVRVRHCDQQSELCIAETNVALPGIPLKIAAKSGMTSSNGNKREGANTKIAAAGFAEERPRKLKLIQSDVTGAQFSASRDLYEYALPNRINHLGGPLLNNCRQILGISHQVKANTSSSRLDYVAVGRKALLEIFERAGKELSEPPLCSKQVAMKPTAPAKNTGNQPSQPGKNTQPVDNNKAKPASSAGQPSTGSKDLTPAQPLAPKQNDGIRSIILLSLALVLLILASFLAITTFLGNPLERFAFLEPVTRKLKPKVHPASVTGGVDTHIGGREEQQDAAAYFQGADMDCCFAVVADGMGGHSGGAIASNTLIDTISRAWNEVLCRPQDVPAFLQQGFLQAHHAVNEAGAANSSIDPHSTVVGLCIRDGIAYHAHVGDSRLYLLRDGKVIKLTKDHSVAQMLVDSGEISEAEMATHPDQGSLLRSIGGEDDPDITHGSLETFAGDAFLLCSDGLWETVTTDDMHSAMSQHDLSNGSRTLAQLAARRGGETGDNVSVVLVRCDE